MVECKISNHGFVRMLARITSKAFSQAITDFYRTKLFNKYICPSIVAWDVCDMISGKYTVTLIGIFPYFHSSIWHLNTFLEVISNQCMPLSDVQVKTVHLMHGKIVVGCGLWQDLSSECNSQVVSGLQHLSGAPPVLEMHLT